MRQDEGDFLVFENRKGSAELVSEKMLKDILKQCKTEIELVFVSSCHSEFIGQIFFNAGIEHVICIKESEKISDEASITFAKTFYQSLFSINKKSICDAFNAAKESVKFQSSAESSGIGEHNKYVLLSRCRKTCASFDTDLSIGQAIDKSDKPKFAILPSRVEHFVGRETICQKVVEHMISSRLVCLTGVIGIGKSAILKEVSHYVLKRDLIRDGVIYLSLVDCHSMENFSKRLNSIVQSYKDEPTTKLNSSNVHFTPEECISKDFSFFKDSNLLFVLDNCDMIMKLDNISFNAMIEAFLHKCGDARILMSSQIPIVNVKDAIPKIIEVRSLSPDDSLTLLMNKSVTRVENEELHELMDDPEI